MSASSFHSIEYVSRSSLSGNSSEIHWCFSQVKGTVEEDVTEGMLHFHVLFAVTKIAKHRLSCQICQMVGGCGTIL